MIAISRFSRVGLLTLSLVLAASFSNEPSWAGGARIRKAAVAGRPTRVNAMRHSVNWRLGGLGTPTTGDVATLREAYQVLASANHDYQGHRVKAMKAIHQAAKLMGANFGKANSAGKGKAKINEPQDASDVQLREVQVALQQMKGSVSGGNAFRVSGHIDRAIHELSAALTIK